MHGLESGPARPVPGSAATPSGRAPARVAAVQGSITELTQYGSDRLSSVHCARPQNVQQSTADANEGDSYVPYIRRPTHVAQSLALPHNSLRCRGRVCLALRFLNFETEEQQLDDGSAKKKRASQSSWAGGFCRGRKLVLGGNCGPHAPPRRAGTRDPQLPPRGCIR